MQYSPKITIKLHAASIEKGSMLNTHFTIKISLTVKIFYYRLCTIVNLEATLGIFFKH